MTCTFNIVSVAWSPLAGWTLDAVMILLFLCFWLCDAMIAVGFGGERIKKTFLGRILRWPLDHSLFFCIDPFDGIFQT